LPTQLHCFIKVPVDVFTNTFTDDTFVLMTSLQTAVSTTYKLHLYSYMNTFPAASLQVFGVEPQVLFDERGDEEVAVVVPVLHA